jgi:hypothetical protein
MFDNQGLTTEVCQQVVMLETKPRLIERERCLRRAYSPGAMHDFAMVSVAGC